MKIAIMGSGGTGGYFGGLLARGGHDVTFFARGAHLDALRTRGLAVRSQLVGDFSLPVKATDNANEIGPVDLVLFCVKTYDTEEAAAFIQPVIGPDTIVLPVQNGIDVLTGGVLSGIVGQAHILGGVAIIASNVTAPGVITHNGGPGKILIGELDGGASERVTRLVDIMQAAGINAEARIDIEIAIWEKFVFICGVGGITALTRLPLGPILQSAECSALLAGVMEEAAAAARAHGVALPDDAVERSLALAAGLGPSARGSLFHDLEAGKRLEIDALCGAVVRLGREHGVAMPYNVAVAAALQPFANGQPILT